MKKSFKRSTEKICTNDPTFIETIFNIKGAISLPVFPCYNYSPVHVCTRSAVSNYAVNASGNLYIEYNPSRFSTVSSSSNSTQSHIVLNNIAYTDINTTSLAVPNLATGLMDPGLQTSLCLDNVPFHNALVAGFQVRITATGVALTERKGFLTIVEYTDDQHLVISNASANNTSFNNYMNARPARLQLLNPHKIEVDLATAYTSAYQYTWIPNFAEQSATFYDYDIATYIDSASNIIDNQNDYKKLAIYVNGADPDMTLRVEVDILYNCTPNSANLRTFPIQYGDNYIPHNTIFQKLGQKKELVLAQLKEEGIHSYIGPKFENNIVKHDNEVYYRMNKTNNNRSNYKLH